MRPFQRSLTTALAACATLACGAVPAAAGTVALSIETIEQPKSPSFQAARTTWTAAPGEANRLTVAIGERGEIVLRDAAAPLSPGEGCRALADGAVACTPQAGIGNSFAGDAGDGDDVVAVSAPHGGSAAVTGGEGRDRIASTGAYLRADGGPGGDVLEGGERDDTLAGGAGPDELRGGAGDDGLSGDDATSSPAADVLDGGPGAHDGVSYQLREEAVVVDLAAGTGGVAGEGDRLVGIEDVVGGEGADVLRGNDVANELQAGDGHRADVIEGAGGDDDLSGTGPDPGRPGVLRIDGGAGDDRLLAYGRSDLDAGEGDDYLWGHGVGPFRCGPDRDRVAPHQGALVAADCERIELWLFDLTALRVGSDRLAVTLRGTGYPRGEWCGAELLLRTRSHVLARTTARIDNRRRRRLTLAPRSSLPATARLAVGVLTCARGRAPMADRETGRESFRVARR